MREKILFRPTARPVWDGQEMSPRTSSPLTTGARALPPSPLAMGFMAMFKKKDPKDLVREWQSKMRTEMRGVDRQIRGTDLCRE